MHVASNKAFQGVRGHAPWREILKFSALKCCFQPSDTKEAISWVLADFMIKT